MQIIIIGCGKVGLTIAEQLSAEGHNLVLVDLSSEKIQEATETFDVLGIAGNGASFQTQMEAGVENSDLLIAVTGSDELNLLCCLIAKKTGHCNTIARVRNPLYNMESGFIKESLGISMIINPELTTAQEISRLLRFPSAIKIDTFAKGRAELLKFKLKPEFCLNDYQVSDIISRLKCDVLVCAVERGDEVIIPNGRFVLKDNDLVSIMATPQNSAAFFRKIGVKTNQVKSTLIVGGGTIAHYLAKQLLEMGIAVKIIEQNKERCEALSELMPDSVIINGDGTDQKLLMESGLSHAESFVSLTNLDEENILLSMFAKKHSDAKIVTKVNRTAFTDVIEELDVGSVIYPKYLAASYIIKYVRATDNSMGSSMETLYKILDNRAEALEFSITETCPATDIPLCDMTLKPNVLICGINRKGKLIIPRGQDKFLIGDTVIVVTTNKGLHNICDILKK